MLDKRYSDMPKQIENVNKIFAKAKACGEVVTLHSVHTTNLMIELLQNADLAQKTVLWHSFNGSPETAAILYKMGVIISISPKCTKDVAELYKANPLFVLETDYTGTDSEEHDTILLEHYKKCAVKLNMTIEELDKRCRENAVAFTNTADFRS